ncbi:hypothetical protein [Corynebacterium doosanense]|uniref:Sec-independent protein translocase protein TatB n=1 Tax=Corynebacterium doosanense CAU 212 = DSM 45436 TaxID=558173 RepID=A0A097IFA4_9CORY|nr:hypothetical protein [Corynebacterium doosanense]AIT60795.1 preprotein translocase [Corynebacterium doosanense CAU 212 = DSM 45436]
MFDNIGWGEIAALLVLALIIIGPERLPGVIKDVRAAIFAARRAIANARAELDGEFGEEFSELRAPISQAAEWGRMGPRRAITKALFDGDDQALDDFDPRRIISSTGVNPTTETPAQAARRLRREADALESRAAQQAQQSQQQTQPAAQPQPREQGVDKPRNKGNFETGGGFSWADIT